MNQIADQARNDGKSPHDDHFVSCSLKQVFDLAAQHFRQRQYAGGFGPVQVLFLLLVGPYHAEAHSRPLGELSLGQPRIRAEVFEFRAVVPGTLSDDVKRNVIDFAYVGFVQGVI